MRRLAVHAVAAFAALTMLACSDREGGIDASSVLSRITIGSDGEAKPAPAHPVKKKRVRKDDERLAVATPDMLDAPLAGAEKAAPTPRPEPVAAPPQEPAPAPSAEPLLKKKAMDEFDLHPYDDKPGAKAPLEFDTHPYD